MHPALCFACCCSTKLCFVLKFVSCSFSNLHVFPITITPCSLSSFLLPLRLLAPDAVKQQLRKQIETLQVSYHGYPQGKLTLPLRSHVIDLCSTWASWDLFCLNIEETMLNSFIRVLLSSEFTQENHPVSRGHWWRRQKCFIWGGINSAQNSSCHPLAKANIKVFCITIHFQKMM